MCLIDIASPLDGGQKVAIDIKKTFVLPTRAGVAEQCHSIDIHETSLFITCVLDNDKFDPKSTSENVNQKKIRVYRYNFDKNLDLIEPALVDTFEFTSDYLGTILYTITKLFKDPTTADVCLSVWLSGPKFGTSHETNTHPGSTYALLKIFAPKSDLARTQ
jgi:hypothetical protein